MYPKRIFILFLAFSLILAGCGGLGAPKSVKVAISLPMTLGLGEGLHNAAKLAMENAEGKAGDVNVELVLMEVGDPEGPPISAEVEEKNVAAVIADPAFVGFIGSFASSSNRVSIPALNRASVAQISATGTWPGLTKPGYGAGEPGVYYPTGQQSFFRTVPSDETQAAAAARWAQTMGYTKVFITHSDDAYGVGLTGIFEVTASDIGLQIVGKEQFSATDSLQASSFSNVVDKAITAEADLIYLASGVASNGIPAVEAFRLANPTIAIIGPDGLTTDDLITQLGTDMTDGIYGTTVAIPADKLTTPAAIDFLNKFQAAYGRAPSAYETAMYEAVNVMLYAISKAKQPTREGVLEAMQNLGPYEGVFGAWTFDQQGDISIANISSFQIQNGKWMFLEPIK